MRLDASIHAAEQEGRGVNRLADGQDAVVQQHDALLTAERRGDALALFRLVHDAAEGRVHSVVFVEAGEGLVVPYLGGQDLRGEERNTGKRPG